MRLAWTVWPSEVSPLTPAHLYLLLQVVSVRLEALARQETEDSHLLAEAGWEADSLVVAVTEEIVQTGLAVNPLEDRVSAQ